MSPQLQDFLSKALVKEHMPRPDQTRPLKDAFLTYLHTCGIEFTNYGAVHLNDSGTGKAYFADGNFRGSWIEEYLAEGLTPHDYVLNRAKALKGNRTEHFALGEWLAKHVADDTPITARVLRGAGDAGMQDGIGLVGRKPNQNAGQSEELGWSFAFGGEMGVGAHIEHQLPEITIAAAALIDRLTPEINAGIDCYKKPLSARERDVLGYFASGLQRDRVADAIGTSVHTVDFHCRNLRSKLGAATMAEAVAKGYRYGQL